MDKIDLKITTKEDLQNTFADASSEQITTITTDISADLPKVEHVHSIESTTLLWLLLIWFVVRMAQPFIINKKRMENGSGSGQAANSGALKKTPARRKPPERKGS